MGSEQFSVLPLVVDLDGTLTPTDTLVESVVCLLKVNPFNIFRIFYWLVAGGGRASFKHRLAAESGFDPRNLPWRQDFVIWLTSERDAGRRIVLATAAHVSIAQKVSQHLGLFHSVLATEGTNNLKGTAKLAAIRQHLGPQFAYAGDSKADLPIWRASTTAVLVGTSSAVTREVRNSCSVEKEFGDPLASWRVWLKAMRVHQWVKNLLIFVPLFTAFAFGDLNKAAAAVFAFIAFSLAASATYLFNDMWDLESDRKHLRKKHRPFASAQIPLTHGVAMAVVLLVVAMAIALWTSMALGVMVLGYILLTTLYSLTLKQYVLVDVLMLAILYTYRVLAGSVATNIAVTPWLLAFCIFTFFSLALVKRCAELVSLQEAEQAGAHGRDYRVGDLVVLWPLGVGASLSSVVVFGLYISTPGAVSRYANPNALWFVGIGLLYWISRLWVKTARGEMHDDPIVFALRDRSSRLAVLAMVAMTVFAHFVR